MRPDQLIKDGRKTLCTIRHRTLDDVMTAIQESLDREQTYSSRRKDKDFTGTSSLEEYRDMLLHGWDAGVDGVEGLDGLSTDHAEKLCFERNVGGAFPIVPAHLAGMPNSMLSPTIKTADSARGLTLVIDSCFSYGVETSTIITYAREVMKLVAWLQAEQLEVAVYVVVPIMLGSNNNKRVLYVTPIREAGQVFQPERIASILHPSWLRRGWFATLEYDYHVRGVKDAACCRSGYGSVTHAKPEELRAAIPEAYSVILLPKVGVHDPAKALREAVTLKLRRGDA
ncbi:MAG: hypothetical protein GTO41_11785 [Burkholderiales bacterium]|nr:hypothetical protein [Burkholderiales bacterium]